MKVLQVIDSLAMGGAEKLLLDSIPLYNKKNIQVDIAVLHDNNYPFMQILEKEKCCKIYKLSRGSVYNPFLVIKLAKIINEYDVIHVHLFPAQYWVVLAKIITFSKVKLVFTEHSTSNRRVENKFFRIIDRFFYKFYIKVGCISDLIYQILNSKMRIPSTKLEVIYNGINLEHYKNQINNTNIGTKKSVNIIQVSRFFPPKDQKTLISSLLYLPEKYSITLVGDGPLRSECQALVTQLNLDHRVKFLGNRNDVPELLLSSDIVVLSSHYEGLSLSSIEGMASGKPFIASSVPGLKDIVKEYGILFDEGDAQQLANKILTLEDPNIYYRVANNCQARAQQFDIQNMVNKYINLYEKISQNN